MQHTCLTNYLVANRKRMALSQGDVAFLLGLKSGAAVSRDETSTKIPNLETALAYEAIYQTPVSELFIGLYEQVKEEVITHARRLNAKSPAKRQAHWVEQRDEMLTALANLPVANLAEL